MDHDKASAEKIDPENPGSWTPPEFRVCKALREGKAGEVELFFTRYPYPNFSAALWIGTTKVEHSPAYSNPEQAVEWALAQEDRIGGWV